MDTIYMIKGEMSECHSSNLNLLVLQSKVFLLKFYLIRRRKLRKE